MTYEYVAKKYAININQLITKKSASVSKPF